LIYGTFQTSNIGQVHWKNHLSVLEEPIPLPKKKCSAVHVEWPFLTYHHTGICNWPIGCSLNFLSILHWLELVLIPVWLYCDSVSRVALNFGLSSAWGESLDRDCSQHPHPMIVKFPYIVCSNQYWCHKLVSSLDYPWLEIVKDRSEGTMILIDLKLW